MSDKFDNFLQKFASGGEWSSENERVITDPYDYISSIPGKELRSALIDAFNVWLKVEETDLQVIKKVVGMLHNASLLMDDIEDNSGLRRGQPVAHHIFGVPQTLNSANYIYFKALSLIQTLSTDARWQEDVTGELLNLHRGQGLDLYWRENLICPTEGEYLEMVNNKTGGLFRLSIKLMKAASNSTTDFIPLANLIGIIYQIRDDFVNLTSEDYSENKGFCEDLSEGKFSFPIIHAIREDGMNKQILNILRQRPTSNTTKKYAVEYMRSRTKSFEYCEAVLANLISQAHAEVNRLGGNPAIEAILAELEK